MSEKNFYTVEEKIEYFEKVQSFLEYQLRNVSIKLSRLRLEQSKISRKKGRRK